MAHHIPKVGFISLGCPKALVDSEQIITRLRAEGYDISPTYNDADLVVVNTCGFIDDAVEESLEAIGEALNENGKVIVTGCLGAKGDIVARNYPQVLAITGPHAAQEVMEAVHAHLPPEHDPLTSLIPPQGIKLTPRHFAYLKISEGCNHRCTFCIIPSLRGDLVSRPVGEVLTEAENLINAGVRELLVISQDTSAYGVDAKYQTDFWNGKPVKTKFETLAQELGDMNAWIRMHYVYPYPHVDNVIPLMAEGKILPYLDIPFQHASQKVLKAMKRPASSENNLQRIKAWRNICPDITLRSTFIVGFPGETEDDFSELLDFINEAELDRVGCFTYSPVEGAVANDIAKQVPEDIKQERLRRFMTLQEEISAGKLSKKVGQTLQVIVDEVDEEGIIARSMADAPEIDGIVFVDTDEIHQPGTFLTVKITDSNEHDLFATVESG
ncbi:MAG: 30S ribosomal protein S12 methylthiotransferase RimO [Gammaproteobacteria bacterium]|nr:30S ribosomal protein S12 methylthiotransferase RimO [Gammaproteobacteria bacterium]MCW8909629.1 30S ribosomal protein S12 methylthiotransferase RimO [Gammaproteobacteria bacterium]MCW9004951.1 30S ribosomal protein S12 methylthiotransferase RimO [Gammaproteobacteria bacterium]MCW9056854.1 30S ribosomal protein S12 methylthiotransferase RimO [Gammaproteobacteria bacterium]